MSKRVLRMTKNKSGKKSKRNSGNRWIKPDDLKLREKAFLYAERAPTIAYSGWESALKEQSFQDWIAYYRICEAKWCVNNEVATEYEAFTYLYTASLATPFGREWFRIYMYLFNKFYGHLLKHNPIEKVEELTEYEKRLLWGLKRWIFKEQMGALKKSRRRSENKGKRQKSRARS